MAHVLLRRAIPTLAAALALGAIPLAASATPAGADVSFTCVAQSANTCLVTIPLTSNMNEQISSTMPDTAPWFLNLLEGSVGTGGYGITAQSWNGNPNVTQGTVWSAQLTTNAQMAGAYAALTFVHVHSTVPPKHYGSFSYRYPATPATGSVVTVTGIVRPVPPRGHLVLQRQGGATWANVVGFAYSAKTKQWSASFRWPYPKRTTRTFRLFATAAPGLLATAGPAFRMSTHG